MIAYKRIYICGFTASGKSTLAAKLSKKYSLPVFVTDNFTYSDATYTIYRTETQRATLLKKTATTENWIIEGVHRKEWIDPGFKRAEIIVILWPSWCRLFYQTVNRYFAQGKPTTFSRLLKFIWWMIKGQKRFITAYISLAQKYNKKYFVLRSRRNVSQFVYQ